jgi:hypothetical protein
MQGDGRNLAVSAQTARARWPVYPGPAAVLTLTQVQLLRLDATPDDLRAAARGHDGGLSGTAQLPELQPPEPCWQHRFLSSALMQRLPPTAWQRLLRAMVGVSFNMGEAVVRQGQPADLCYVLRNGRAEVRRDDHVLATLSPGDFFGEEALITGSGRNASVVMVESGSVMALSAEDFQRLLLAQVVHTIDEPGGRMLLSIQETGHLGDGDQIAAADSVDPGARRDTLHLPLRRLREAVAGLRMDIAYVVTGGSASQRALAVFLMAEHGVVAAPLDC